MVALVAFGGAGGIVTVGGAAWIIARAIFRQTSATETNTLATEANTAAIGELKNKFTGLERTVAVQGAEIAGLKEAVNGRTR